MSKRSASGTPSLRHASVYELMFSICLNGIALALGLVRVRVRVGARVGVRVRVRVEVRATVRVWVRAAVGGTEALRRQALEVREGHRLRADQRPVVQHGSAYRLSKARPTRVSSRPRPAWGPACSSGVRARVAYVPLHPLSHSAERQVACGLAHDAHGPRVARVGQRLRRRRAGQEGLLQQRRRLPGMQGKRSAAGGTGWGPGRWDGSRGGPGSATLVPRCATSRARQVVEESVATTRAGSARHRASSNELAGRGSASQNATASNTLLSRG